MASTVAKLSKFTLATLSVFFSFGSVIVALLLSKWTAHESTFSAVIDDESARYTETLVSSSSVSTPPVSFKIVSLSFTLSAR